MRISISLENDQDVMEVVVEHPFAELAMARATRVMNLLNTNLYHSKKGHGFATPEMEDKP